MLQKFTVAFLALVFLFIIGMGLWITILLPDAREKFRQQAVGISVKTYVAKHGERLFLSEENAVAVWFKKASTSGGYLILVRTPHCPPGQAEEALDEREFGFPLMRDYMKVDLQRVWKLPFTLYVLGVDGNSIRYAIHEHPASS